MVIRAHQSSSELIRAHQWSSVVISGHQWSSEVIRGHHAPPNWGLAAMPKGAPPPIRLTGTLGTEVETLIAKSDVKIVAGLRLPARLNGFRAFVGDVSLRISLTSCTKRFMSDSSVTAEKPLSIPGLAAASLARSVVART